MNKNLADQTYWNAGYANHKCAIAPPADDVRKWLEYYFQKGEGDCIELGCFPGRYLAVFGELGYTLSGIDLTQHLDQMIVFFKDNNYQTGDFYRDDFLSHTFSGSYHIACSFGFIEHFDNWQDIIKKQAKLVEKNGYLVISAPNFRGYWQKLLHKHLDRKNFFRHNLDSMDPSQWAQIAASQGFEVIFSGYFGKFDFWADKEKRNFLQKKLIQLVTLLLPALRALPEAKASYSPYCGLIAKKL